MSSAWVDLKEVGKGQWKMRQISGVEPYDSRDADTQAHLVERRRRASGHYISRTSRSDQRHALLAPDGARGESRAQRPLWRYLRGHESFFCRVQKWKALARPAPGPGGLRRPLWMPRVVRPADSAYMVEAAGPASRKVAAAGPDVFLPQSSKKLHIRRVRSFATSPQVAANTYLYPFPCGRLNRQAECAQCL